MDGHNKKRYVKKVGNGDVIDHLALLATLGIQDEIFFRNTQILSADTRWRMLWDYASQLIPRAVGYSAGLLNYFFRGDIRLDMSPHHPGYVM